MTAEHIAPAEDFEGLIAVTVESWGPWVSPRSKKAFAQLKLSNGGFVTLGYELAYRRLAEQVRMTFPKIHLEKPEELVEFLVLTRMPIILGRSIRQIPQDKDCWLWYYYVPKTKGVTNA